jgi:flagellin
MAIADSLKAQALGLGQAINNANDGIGVVQTADGALDEYINIINTVRTKAIQAASDGQNVDSRAAIQRDINKLLEEAQNIATTTAFNGQQLLDGTFTDKAFHIGAYKDETVNVSIANAQTNSIGAFASVDSTATTSAAALSATFAINGTLTGASVADTASGANTTAHSAVSAWAKAVQINSVANTTGVKASAETTVTGSAAITAGTITAGTANNALIINGVDIGTVVVSANDADGALRNAINAVSNQTNVTASIDAGKLVLTANDGSDITLGAVTTSSNAIVGLGDTTSAIVNTGVVSLTSSEAITVTAAAADVGFATGTNTTSTSNAINTSDVTTRDAAELTILRADYALLDLDTIRSELGSVQNQLESTIRNISVTQVNVTAAESQIRDVDFAAESANFAKLNILAQSGSYALSQANAVQQNVLRLLQ